MCFLTSAFLSFEKFKRPEGCLSHLASLGLVLKQQCAFHGLAAL